MEKPVCGYKPVIRIDGDKEDCSSLLNGVSCILHAFSESGCNRVMFGDALYLLESIIDSVNIRLSEE